MNELPPTDFRLPEFRDVLAAAARIAPHAHATPVSVSDFSFAPGSHDSGK